MTGGPREAQELSTEIRPGVMRPDWSVVTTPAARKALNGRMSARAGLLDKWSQALDRDEDLVWQTVLHSYAASGRPPHADECLVLRQFIALNCLGSGIFRAIFSDNGT